MGTFIVTGPDGKRYKVTGDGTADEALKQVQQQAAPPSVAGDIMSTIPGALRRGTEMLVGMPGDVNNLTQSVAGKVSRALFGDKATETMKSYVPQGLQSEGVTTGDVQKQTDQIIGPSYQPQTRPGRYVGAITEQAPGMVLGPGTKLAKVMMSALSGAGGEFVGEHTDNPWAKTAAQVAGTLIGGRLPGAAVEQTARSAARDANIATLDREGIPMTAGQRGGSKAAQYMETELGGSKYGDFIDRQKSGFTDATMRRLGEPGGSALPEDIARARANIGGRFDQLAATTLTPFDPILQNRLLNTAIDYRETAPQVVPAVEGMMNRMGEMAATNGGQLTGQNYQELTTRLRELADKGDAPTANALDAFRSTLDDAVERTLSGDQLDQWRQARQQWANLNTVRRSMTGAGVEAASGQIDPGRLRSAISGGGNEASTIAEGRSNLTDLANGGVGVMKDTPGNSGTASRLAARALPATVAGAATGAMTGDPFSAAALAAAGGFIGPEIMGRAVMGPLGQSALLGPNENQRMLLAALLASKPAKFNEPDRSKAGASR